MPPARPSAAAPLWIWPDVAQRDGHHLPAIRLRNEVVIMPRNAD
jgi:hypothetical protein